ncbi:MAG: glycosyltransferase family 2 protein [Erysipelotrichaceae bacterium]|nr:glycosyltransferase family 2 protein [Erysipelotrichaceae bacterium]
MNKEICIIIINYQTYLDTYETIMSLQNQSLKNFDILLIDNGSSDDSGIKLKNDLNNLCEVMLLEKNVGFSAANNIGIEYAKANNYKYIMFLNSDVIADEFLVEELFNNCVDSTLVVPKCYFYYNKEYIWDFGAEYTCFGSIYNYGYGKKDSEKYSKKEKRSLATGCCIMTKINTFNKIGCWDEDYFMYREDTDLSLRCKKNNVYIYAIPNAKLWHKIGGSSGGELSQSTVYYMIRNTLIMNKKIRYLLYGN